ncbi:hypothetical protein J1N35_032649 [Gossypium stocksii]|uniref:RNase H type-1 domain-containing protein n=1 Tax=Gossypium stocksii TaxID=47602 RepID=A0A9D3V4U8_9ROSI|nr:hypothetical protein J1N35_032649 [Gossypium stocksii]
MRYRCSYMWKAVAKAWPLLRSNIIWSIGNGRTVRCWEDNWVPTVGPLNQYIPIHEDVVSRIISISPPSESAGPDILSWFRTTSGVFSVKNVYFLLKEESWNPNDKNWNVVWKVPGPQRVKQFIWLVLKRQLLTNSERVRRGIAQDASCQLCGHSLEDNLHTLRDCPFAKEIWKQVIPPNYFDSFFAGMCFYLNIDGVVNSASGLSATGGVIRDAVAELWGIWDGLLLLQKQGYDEVIIQSDNLENVITIGASKPDDPKSSLIMRIHQILAFEEKWSLNFIPREYNRVTDALAKMALARSETLQIIEEPPLEIQALLKDEFIFDNVTRA